MVRSTIDGQLYVRKRKRLCPVSSDQDNETKNALPHANIPQLISQTRVSYTAAPPPDRLLRQRKVGYRDIAGFYRSTKSSTLQQPSAVNVPGTADLWSYANGRDLGDLVGGAARLKKPLPVLAIYKLIHELVSTIVYLHAHNIVHGDLIPDNIFVHWANLFNEASSDVKTQLPTFLLGDFGISSTIATPEEALRSQNARYTADKEIYEDFSSVLDCVAYTIIGDPAFDRKWPDEQTMQRYAGIHHGDVLWEAFKQLSGLTYDLKQAGVSRATDLNGKEFENIVGKFLKDIDAAAQHLSNTTDQTAAADISATLTALHPVNASDKREPFMVLDREFLLGMTYRVPGPWCAAELDPETGDIVPGGVNPKEKFCAGEAMITRLMSNDEQWDAKSTARQVVLEVEGSELTSGDGTGLPRG